MSRIKMEVAGVGFQPAASFRLPRHRSLLQIYSCVKLTRVLVNQNGGGGSRTRVPIRET